MWPLSRIKQSSDTLHDAHVREMCVAWDSRHRERLYQGRCLNALSRQVEVLFGTIDAETRRRTEEFIGCTLEQSYSEFTVELKNAVARMLDDIYNSDYSREARHRGRSKRQRTAISYFH
jgi:hypothetical protein